MPKLKNEVFQSIIDIIQEWLTFDNFSTECVKLYAVFVWYTNSILIAPALHTSKVKEIFNVEITEYNNMIIINVNFSKSQYS